MALHARLHGGPRAFDGRNTQLYDFVASRLLRRVYRRLARDVAALAPEGAAVLDLGTGPGVLLLELAALRPDLDVTGLDRSADMIAAANRKLARFGPRARAVTGDVASLPFGDASFDLVVSSLSLHHWDHPVEAGNELARVLRPGGKACLYDVANAPFDAVTPGWAQVQRSTVAARIPFLGPLNRLLLSESTTC
jgi:ubiquinone/menaquinone biosynthesis C-methylase UbiE